LRRADKSEKRSLMGMFDDIRCSAKLPGTPPEFIKPGHSFQTKDLDCALRHFEITATGRLVDRSGADLEFHGDIEFYGGNGLHRPAAFDCAWCRRPRIALTNLA
jgi:hypothetical protein